MRALRLLFLLTPLVCLGCDEPVETPTSATTTTTPAPILFTGTLQPRAVRFYSYTLQYAGTVTAMLASVERNGAPAGNPLEIGIGVPAGTGCAATMTLNGPPSLVPQLRHDAAAGTYCVRIADVDGLPQAMTFTIRVTHP